MISHVTHQGAHSVHHEIPVLRHCSRHHGCPREEGRAPRGSPASQRGWSLKNQHRKMTKVASSSLSCCASSCHWPSCLQMLLQWLLWNIKATVTTIKSRNKLLFKPASSCDWILIHWCHYEMWPCTRKPSILHWRLIWDTGQISCPRW